MQKLSNKRLLKHRTLVILEDLLKSLVTPDQAVSITRESVMAQLGKRTYYKDQNTGTVHLGLCYKQVKKEVKKNPYVTVQQIKEKHKLV
jgi:poly-D-alanine transfer protein DltD